MQKCSENLKLISLEVSAVKNLARDLIVKFITIFRFSYLDPKAKILPIGTSGYEADFVCISETLRKSQKICIFAHFDPGSIISISDLKLISCIRKAGFEIFLSTTSDIAKDMHEEFWEKYQNIIDGLIIRKNFGFDFASWAVGIEKIKNRLHDLDQLILLNNSTLVRVEEMTSYVNKIALHYDVGSLINSREFRPHLMSFFLFFNRKAIKSKKFEIFWESVLTNPQTNNSKWEAIRKFELTWGSHFKKDKSLRVGSLFVTPKWFLRNPTTSKYVFTLINQDFPLIKKSLFKMNYEGIDLDALTKKLNESNPNLQLPLQKG